MALESSEATATGTDKAPLPQPKSWDPVSAKGCDPDVLVVAVVSALFPSGLRRYLQRRSKVSGFSCFEYESKEDDGFNINVPSHAFSITSELTNEWKALLKKDGVDEKTAIYVKTNGVDLNVLALVKCGDGDKTRLMVEKHCDVASLDQ